MSILKELAKIVKIGDPKTKVSAANTFFQSVEKHTKFLEAFGYKDKVAEKLKFEDVSDYNLVDAYKEVMDEEIRKLSRKKKKVNSSKADNKKQGCKVPGKTKVRLGSNTNASVHSKKDSVQRKKEISD